MNLRLIYLLLILLPSFAFSQEICDNGIDDDGDGLIDMNDFGECFCDSVITMGREYIPNPSFEDSVCCPDGPAQLFCAQNWIQASDATSDYFDTCNFSNIVSPPNYPIPGNGSSYTGIISGTGYIEYVGTCLDTALEAGESFTMTFYTAWGSGDSIMNFSLYGTTTCDDLPWTNTSCPIGVGNWELLASQTVTFDTIGQWIVVSLSFTPTSSINAIAVGGPCNATSSNLGVNYYYIDELSLDSTTNLPVGIDGNNGLYCLDSMILVAATELTGGTWQWYKEGVALVGQIYDTLDTGPYGLGNYSVVYAYPDGCFQVYYTVADPVFPEASYTSVLDTCSGFVTFNNTSTVDFPSTLNIHLWQFGDNGISLQEHPTHQYLSNGTFNVSLIEFTQDGCPDTMIIPIEHLFNLEADFNTDHNNIIYPASDDTIHLCYNSSLIYNDLSTISSPQTITNWLWTFGDNTSSSNQNPIHLLPSAGLFNTQLVVYANNGCTDTINQPIEVHHYPIADILFSVNELQINSNPTAMYNFCVGDTFSIFNLSTINPPDTIQTTFWTVNGMPWNTGVDSTWIIESDTSYQIVLTTIAETGCASYDSINISFNAIDIPQILVNPETCPGSADGSISIQGIGGTHIGDYDLDITDLQQILLVDETIPNGSNYSYNVALSGVYTISITNIPGCSWDTMVSITSIDPPINIMANLGHPQCFGTPTGSIIASSDSTYLFNIKDDGGNIVNNTGTNAANTLPAGNYSISILTSNNCYSQIDVVLLDPPEMEIISSISNPLCHSDSTGFIEVDSVFFYQGNYGDIDFIWTPNPTGSNGQNETDLIDISAGLYILEITDGSGCIYSQLHAVLNPPPLRGKPAVEAPTFCRTADYQSGNGVVTIETASDSSGTPPLNYFWKSLVDGQTANTSTLVVRAPGEIQITITDGHNCVHMDTIHVDSLNPIANFIIDSDQFAGPLENEGTEALTIKITNTSENFAQAHNPNADTIFQWHLYHNQNPINESNWFFTYRLEDKVDTTYNGEEIYEVCLITKNYNDCADTLCQNVIVHDYPLLVVPNVFTPGSSPNNTFFFPSEGINQFSCIMMNRYGLPVYEFNSIDDQWDGNHYKNDLPCADGTYFFIYNAVSTNGTPFQSSGNVTLIRN